jgi:hypothetical protein
MLRENFKADSWGFVLNGWNKAGQGIEAPLFSLCPNCARQGQIFPKINKRNQK